MSDLMNEYPRQTGALSANSIEASGNRVVSDRFKGLGERAREIVAGLVTRQKALTAATVALLIVSGHANIGHVNAQQTPSETIPASSSQGYGDSNEQYEDLIVNYQDAAGSTEASPKPTPKLVEPSSKPMPKLTEPNPKPSPKTTEPSPKPTPKSFEPSPKPSPKPIEISPKPTPKPIEPMPKPTPKPIEPNPKPTPKSIEPSPKPMPKPTPKQ